MVHIYSYIFFLLALSVTTGEAIQCLLCDNVAEPRDCSHLVTCGPNEICYARRKILQNLHQYYELGCFSRDVCQQASILVGKRDGIDDFSHQNKSNADDKSRDLQSRDKITRNSDGSMTVCNKCCDKEDGCNKDLCYSGGSTPTSKLRCLSCSDVTDSNDCQHVVECSRDQFCYVHKGLNANFASFEIRYTLGCMGLLQCNAFKKIYPQSCVVCCNDTDFCNSDACDHWSLNTHAHASTQITHTTTTTMSPPSVVIHGNSKDNFLQETQLSCVATPAANKFEWKFNGSSTLPVGVTTQFIPYTGSASGYDMLHISNLTESSFGTYTCVATANGQTGKQSHYIGILGEKPTVRILKPPILGNFALQCKATGYPMPRMQWDFIPNAGGHSIPPNVESNNLDYTSILFVKVYNPVYHSGRWICKASNSEGSAVTEVRVP